MTLTLARTALLAVLRVIHRALTPAKGAPLHAMVLLLADAVELRVCAQDHALALAATLPVQPARGGFSALVSTDSLLHAVEQSAETITFTVDEKELTLKSTGRKFKLALGYALDFPAHPTVANAKWHSIGAALLSALLTRVGYAAERSHQRPAFRGIWVHPEGTGVAAFATDGLRAAFATASGSVPETLFFPIGLVTALSAVLPESGEVEICQAEHRIHLRVGTWDLAHLRTAGASPVPPWRTLLPTTKASTVVVERKALLDACAATDGGEVSVVAKKDAQLLLASHGDGVDRRADVPAEIAGEAGVVVSGTLFRQMVAACEGERASLRFWGAKDPVVIDEADGLAVVQPLDATLTTEEPLEIEAPKSPEKPKRQRKLAKPESKSESKESPDVTP